MELLEPALSESCRASVSSSGTRYSCSPRPRRRRPARARSTISRARSETSRPRNGVWMAVRGTSSRRAVISSAVHCGHGRRARRGHRRRRADPPTAQGARGRESASAHVGPAHLEELLEPDFWKKRREVVLPILDGRLVARELRQLATHEGAEALARDIHILMVAHDEIHRHVERVLGVAVKAEVGLEDEREHAGAGGIGVKPNVRAEA